MAEEGAVLVNPVEKWWAGGGYAMRVKQLTAGRYVHQRSRDWTNAATRKMDLGRLSPFLSTGTVP